MLMFLVAGHECGLSAYFGILFCVFQPRMVALLSVPATQGPLEEMDLELHKIAYSSISIKGEPYDHPLDDWYFRSWTLL